MAGACRPALARVTLYSMALTNYHTHCLHCDGVATPAEMAKAAFAAGFAHLGFSSHAPLPFETSWNMDAADLGQYLRDVRACAAEYSSRMEILCGLEIDWIGDDGGPPVAGPALSAWKGIGLDYSIGSVHYARAEDGALFTVDSPEEEFKADFRAHCPAGGRALTEDYYRRVARMAVQGGFDILGHFDLPRKNNADNLVFDEGERWYRDAVMEALEAVAASGAVVEVNTGGLARARVSEPYPSLWVLKEFKARGVRAVLNADAHRPEHLLANRERGLESLRAAGYREMDYLTLDGWKTQGVDE
jgi:histidinol-phosphatase (PHP family)